MPCPRATTKARRRASALIRMNKMLRKFLQRMITEGSLEIVTSDGSVLKLGNGTGVPARIRFTSAAAERHCMLHPDPGVPEEYMNGGFVI